MVRRKDRFWEHAEEFGNGFECKFCKRDFSGGIPRIKSHLAGIRGRGIDICTMVPKNVQEDARIAIGADPCKKSKAIVGSNDVGENHVNAEILVNLSKGCHQSLMPKITEKDKSMVDKNLTKFIISNNIALDVVEAQSFADFVRGVAEFGHDYKLPCMQSLQTKFIPELEMETKAYIKRVKESWALTGCTLMVQRWHNNFVNVIASSPKGAVFMNLYEIPEIKDINIEHAIDSAIEDIGVDHVVQFITNDARYFYRVGNFIITKHSRIYKIQCIAHQIHSLLLDIFHQVQWVQQLLDDAKSIVEYMYKDAAALSLMRKYTNNRELRYPCSVNIALNCQVLQSIFDNQNELLQLVASTEWEKLDYNVNKVAAMRVIQNTEFWMQGLEVVKALEPIIGVLLLVEDDRATAGYLYEAMDMAKEAIMQLHNNNNGKYEVIVQLFEGRRKNIIHPIHAAAAFLNPAYMCRRNFKENQEMKAGISFVLERLVADEEKKDFVRELQLYRIRISDLFTAMAMEMLETTHPWIWWDYCGDRLPVLRKYAIRILSQPCKCSCLHKVTAFEVASTKKMSRKPQEVEIDVVCLTMNTNIMEQFKTLEARSLEPIDIGKCNQLSNYLYFPQDLYVDTPILDVCSSDDDVLHSDDDSLLGISPRECWEPLWT